MKNLKSIHDIIYFKDWKGKSVKTNITPTIIITMHYQKLKGKRRFKVSSIYSCVILYYNYDARFCKKARYRNIRYSDYTTSTPNNIYVYTWLPFGNVIQCVTYMKWYKTNSNLFFKLHHGNKTLLIAWDNKMSFMSVICWFIVHPPHHLSIYIISFHTCSVLYAK